MDQFYILHLNSTWSLQVNSGRLWKQEILNTDFVLQKKLAKFTIFYHFDY